MAQSEDEGIRRFEEDEEGLHKYHRLHDAGPRQLSQSQSFYSDGEGSRADYSDDGGLSRRLKVTR